MLITLVLLYLSHYSLYSLHQQLNSSISIAFDPQVPDLCFILSSKLMVGFDKWPEQLAQLEEENGIGMSQ